MQLHFSCNNFVSQSLRNKQIKASSAQLPLYLIKYKKNLIKINPYTAVAWRTDCAEYRLRLFLTLFFIFLTWLFNPAFYLVSNF